MNIRQLNIRKIQSESDLARAKECVPKGCTEPLWASTYLIEDGYQPLGVVGGQVVHRLEPLYLKEKNPHALLLAAGFMDGLFRASGVKQYEFFVQDANQDFQKFIERNLAVTSAREKPGLVYFRKLE